MIAIRIDFHPFTTNFNTWSGTGHVRFPWLQWLVGAYRAFHLLSYSNVLKWKFTSRKNITHDLISIHYSPISSHLHQQAASSWAISHLSLADMDPKLMPLLIDANSIMWSKIKTKKAHKNCTWKSVCLSLCFLHDRAPDRGFFFPAALCPSFGGFHALLACNQTAFQLCQHHLLAHNLWSLTRKWAYLTKWVLSNLTSPSCMAIIYMNWKHYLLTRGFITWMVESLHLDGTRSLQLTKTSSEWGGAFKCKEKKP